MYIHGNDYILGNYAGPAHLRGSLRALPIRLRAHPLHRQQYPSHWSRGEEATKRPPKPDHDPDVPQLCMCRVAASAQPPTPPPHPFVHEWCLCVCLALLPFWRAWSEQMEPGSQEAGLPRGHGRVRPA